MSIPAYRSLDWKTPLRSVSLLRHWRLQICIASGIVVSIAFWHSLFPHTFWFMNLWAGGTTGALAGLLPGSMWQLWSSEIRSETSGRLLVSSALAWSLFAAVSVFVIGPDLRAQEREREMIRSIAPGSISTISIQPVHGTLRQIESREAIASFASLAWGAELFYPSHEASIGEFSLTIKRKDGSSVGYDARLPERHREDLVLGFRGYCFMDELIVPGGARWLSDASR